MWRTFQREAEDLAKEWASKDEDLKQKWRSAFKEQKQAEGQLSRAKEKLRRTEERYENKHGTPAPEEMSSRLWYGLLLVVWLLAEVPVNGFAFQLFGESLVFAGVGALLVALVLLPSAHCLGKHVRNTSTWTWKDKAFAAVLTVFPLAVVVSISWMREAYVRYMREEGLSPGLGYLGDGTAFWVLVTINVALFAVATFLAYRKHPKWLLDVREARTEVRSAREQYQEASERCTKAATARQRAFEETRAELRSLQENLRALVGRYRECNLQARLDKRQRQNDGEKRSRRGSEKGSAAEDLGERPEKDANLPPRGSRLALEMPKALENLDWSLTDGPPPSELPAGSGAPKAVGGDSRASGEEAETLLTRSSDEPM